MPSIVQQSLARSLYKNWLRVISLEDSTALRPLFSRKFEKDSTKAVVRAVNKSVHRRLSLIIYLRILRRVPFGHTCVHIHVLA